MPTRARKTNILGGCFSPVAPPSCCPRRALTARKRRPQMTSGGSSHIRRSAPTRRRHRRNFSVPTRTRPYCRNRRRWISAGRGGSSSARIQRRSRSSIPILARACARQRARPLRCSTSRSRRRFSRRPQSRRKIRCRANACAWEKFPADKSAAAKLRFRAADEWTGIAARGHAARIENIPGLRRAEIFRCVHPIIRRTPSRGPTAGASVSSPGNATPAASSSSLTKRRSRSSGRLTSKAC